MDNPFVKTPPGSDEAVAAGCTCPRMDNEYGRGAYLDGKTFYVNQYCPIHGDEAQLNYLRETDFEAYREELRRRREAEEQKYNETIAELVSRM